MSSAMTSAEVSCWLVYLFISSVSRSENARWRTTLLRVAVPDFLGEQVAQCLDRQVRVARPSGPWPANSGASSDSDGLGSPAAS